MNTSMLDALPTSVRYVKNGASGQWWRAAKTDHQIHAGWSIVSHELLQQPDRDAIRAKIDGHFNGRPGATKDFKALCTLLDQPSQHIWVTFQDGCMWWCTVHDEIQPNLDGRSESRGHFWLTCDRPWSNHSNGGRYLATANLPGIITKTAGFKGTVCKPEGWQAILRIIKDEKDPGVAAAADARTAYEAAIASLLQNLRDRDFELLVDLILSRSGWSRLAELGRTIEGVDIDVENAATGEIAFVQIKSAAAQSMLDDYVGRFNERRERYHRMIFAVHTPTGALRPPADKPVQVWSVDRIAQLVVRLGLGEWVANRI